MKINFNNGQNYKAPSFHARNVEIRLADDIMRRTNQEFLKLSPSRIVCNWVNPSTMGKKERAVFEKYKIILERLRDTRDLPSINPTGYLKVLIHQVKTKKLGNCGESASLAKLGLEINGIKAKKVSLEGYKGKNVRTPLDHSFVIVNMAEDAEISNYKTFGKKAYVVDLWDGFVDYVDNAFKRFEAQYSRDIRMAASDTLGVTIKDFEISEEMINLTKKNFPKLKLPDKK